MTGSQAELQPQPAYSYRVRPACEAMRLASSEPYTSAFHRKDQAAPPASEHMDLFARESLLRYRCRYLLRLSLSAQQPQCAAASVRSSRGGQAAGESASLKSSEVAQLDFSLT